MVIGVEDALDRGGIDRLAGERAVEIDDVQILEALRLERPRLRRRIAVKHGRARHVALLEPHAGAVLEVDGGEQDHDWTRSATRGAALAADARSRRERGCVRQARDARAAWRITASTSGIGDQPQAQPLALLRMELGADDGVAADDRGDRAAVVGLGDEIGALGRLEVVGVHEIGVQAVRPERRCRRAADAAAAR